MNIYEDFGLKMYGLGSEIPPKHTKKATEMLTNMNIFKKMFVPQNGAAHGWLIPMHFRMPSRAGGKAVGEAGNV